MRINLRTVKPAMVVKFVGSILLILITIVCLDNYRFLIFFKHSKAEIRSEVLSVFSTLKLKDDKKTVINNLSSFAKSNKGYRVDVNSDRIYLIPPTEFPNITWFWIVTIYLDKSGKVDGVAIRSMDESDIRFCDAPNDKGNVPKPKKQCVRIS